LILHMVKITKFSSVVGLNASLMDVPLNCFTGISLLSMIYGIQKHGMLSNVLSPKITVAVE